MYKVFLKLGTHTAFKGGSAYEIGGETPQPPSFLSLPSYLKKKKKGFKIDFIFYGAGPNPYPIKRSACQSQLILLRLESHRKLITNVL